MSAFSHDSHDKYKKISPVSIAIDGPSGAGKSSLAKNLAKKLGFLYLDTGALYRTVGLYVFEAGIGGYETEKIEACIDSKNIKIDVFYKNGEQKVFLNDRDVSEKIRENNISKYASDVSKIPKVREFLLKTQKEAAEKNNIIMDGRDIGTVILPNASVKIFLTSSSDERARRRYEELTGKGKDVDYNAILKEINERDLQDSSRDAAPLKPAQDAFILDNSDCISPVDTLNKALNIIKERLPDVCIR
ncbi:MAG: (d)CMP kinase [Oscillospiraceae bacterium]|nr:(d)CMP kinase [Oscillospiraceae bacterium]